MTPSEDYRVPVAVKYLLHGRWSSKTLAGMQLVVRPGKIEVVFRMPGVGAVLGSEWKFDALQTSFEASSAPAPRFFSRLGLVPRDWIVLTTTQPGKPKSVAVAAPDMMDEIWSALSKCGATAVR